MREVLLLYKVEVVSMKKFAVALCLAAIAMVGVATIPLAFADVESNDCPGKVLCPITGEVVCKNQCPLIDPDRSDCPGKVECPLTGELVCRDECPLGLTSAVGKPSCSIDSK